MSGRLSSCTECDSADLIEDHCGQTVCTSCGTVVANNSLDCQVQFSDAKLNNLVDENGSFNGRFTAAKYYSTDDKRPHSKVVAYCMKFISHLCTRLVLPEYVCSQSTAMFIDKIKKMQFKYYGQMWKEMLAACCVYIVSRRELCPLTIVQVCQAGRIHRAMLSKMMSTLQRSGVVLKRRASTDLIETVVGHVGWSANFSKKVGDVVEMLEDVLSRNGHSAAPTTVITVAAFLAWQADDWAANSRTNFSVFCKKFKLSSANYWARKVTLAALSDDARRIQWLDKRIPKKEIPRYIDDFIRHHKLTKAMTDANTE